jgi:RNA polymerase sigma factor (sigma-70 family)
VRAQLKRALPAWPDEASELTNDVQMRMHRGFPTFRGEAVCQFVAWARVIAKNVLRDFLNGGPPTLGPLGPEPLSPQPEASDQPVGPEDLVRLAGALEKLPEHYRIVIEARLFDRLSPKVIAVRLSWPQGRVRVYIWRAVRLLARHLREKS